ncbi:unnamed protein product [Acanthoscelides obtectus]|uniref:Uncharacterized protein n=1 Tax=Acanthoscelides obtectus TaxID=200917 RepID=A0A9P0MBU0_ACAOB|nr:unnamed protein product [Acanthoscelides obtectus]CAK1659674.1 hypothetical protein AOBTE_LOCUS21612 [Acanthoscelides obtectus]
MDSIIDEIERVQRETDEPARKKRQVEEGSKKREALEICDAREELSTTSGAVPLSILLNEEGLNCTFQETLKLLKLKKTPSPSPAPSLQHRTENLSALNRRRMSKRRTILYAKIKSLENKVRNAFKLSEKYKNRCVRLKTENTDPNCPPAKVS